MKVLSIILCSFSKNEGLNGKWEENGKKLLVTIFT